MKKHLHTVLFLGIITVNEEGRGLPAHGWSFHQGVCSALPDRCRCRKQMEHTIEKSGAPGRWFRGIFMSGMDCMDDLLKKYSDYMRLEGCMAEYGLANGLKIQFNYEEKNFAHLIGLHKLKDIGLIQFWLDRTNRAVKTDTVLKKIKRSAFTDAMVRGSKFYPDIEKRYESFSYDSLASLTYTDAIINFDPSRIRSRLKSDYLLFDSTTSSGHNFMGIAFDSKKGTRYIETFFHNDTNTYISGQTVVKVDEFTLYGKDGSIIVSDSF